MTWNSNILSALVGKQWQLNGQGEPGYDCFTICKHLYSLVDIFFPTWIYEASDWQWEAQSHLLAEAEAWGERVQEGRVGDFAIINSPQGLHCGVVIEKGKMINCDVKRGVFVLNLKRITSEVNYFRPKMGNV